jgi:hypothetical protein
LKLIPTGTDEDFEYRSGECLTTHTYGELQKAWERAVLCRLALSDGSKDPGTAQNMIRARIIRLIHEKPSLIRIKLPVHRRKIKRLNRPKCGHDRLPDRAVLLRQGKNPTFQALEMQIRSSVTIGEFTACGGRRGQGEESGDPTFANNCNKSLNKHYKIAQLNVTINGKI